MQAPYLIRLLFQKFIGVDSDIRCTRWDDFLVIEGENDNITVYAKGGNHRLAWSDPQYIIVRVQVLVLRM